MKMFWSHKNWRWESVTHIRRFNKDTDYHHIREILDRGGLEPWSTAWKRALDGRSGFVTFALQYIPSLITFWMLYHKLDLPYEHSLMLGITLFVIQQYYLVEYLKEFFMEDTRSMLSDLWDDLKGLHTLSSQEGAFLVAASPDGDIPVGCMSYRFASSNVNTASLHRVYIREEFRGFGIATKLWKEVLKDLRASGVRCVELWTCNAQEPAIGFYQSLGFHLTEAKKPKYWMLHGVKDLKYELYL